MVLPPLPRVYCWWTHNPFQNVKGMGGEKETLIITGRSNIISIKSKNINLH